MIKNIIKGLYTCIFLSVVGYFFVIEPGIAVYERFVNHVLPDSWWLALRMSILILAMFVVAIYSFVCGLAYTIDVVEWVKNKL